MEKYFKLNFPVETEEAQRFWASKHRLNRIKAIIAFSTDLDNANDNLRRAGYSYMYRKKYLKAYSCYVNSPSMKVVIYSDLHDLWYDPKPCTQAVAFIPDSGFESNVSAWNQRKQTITIKMGETITGNADRLESDGSANGGMGYGSLGSGGNSKIAIWTNKGGRSFSIQGVAIGETEFTLTSGDKSSKTVITVKVVA